MRASTQLKPQKQNNPARKRARKGGFSIRKRRPQTHKSSTPKRNDCGVPLRMLGSLRVGIRVFMRLGSSTIYVWEFRLLRLGMFNSVRLAMLDSFRLGMFNSLYLGEFNSLRLADVQDSR